MLILVGLTRFTPYPCFALSITRFRCFHPLLFSHSDVVWFEGLDPTDQTFLLQCTGEPLQWHPVCPAQAPQPNTSYIARWANGYPHKVEASKTESRLSIAMHGLGSERNHSPLTCARCQRHRGRLELLEQAVGGEETRAAAAREALMQDRVPYAGGGTHVGPHREVGLLDYFGHLYSGAE